MAREFKRTDRIAQQFQHELADMLLKDVKDPRIGMVTITEVEVARDLSHSTVYVSTLAQSVGHDPKLQETIDALNDAAGLMRSLMGKRLRLRTIPRFKFVFDAALERAYQIGDLISQTSAQEKENGPVPDSE